VVQVRSRTAVLKTIYVYPDGHANITFEDGTNWPIADHYELIELLAGHLLRPMQKQAKRLAVTRKAAEAIVHDFHGAPGND
jgi:uncharacterized membrane protein YcjF (UPF0283 family)